MQLVLIKKLVWDVISNGKKNKLYSTNDTHIAMKYFPSILSSSLGNVLEWYDFGLFTIFSTLFSRLFFRRAVRMLH